MLSPMSTDQWILTGLLVGTLGLFLWGKLRPDLVALIALVLAVAAQLVPASKAFIGFGHPAVITVAAVLIVSQGLASSGVVTWATRPIQGLADRPWALLVGLTVTVTVLSAFINNVGALALLLPVTLRLSRESGRPPSFFLMPLAFGSLLGGMTTLIGTPPNLIVAGFRADALGEPFGLFDFTPVGGLVALGGVSFMVLWGWRLVPERAARVGSAELMKVGPYLTEISIPEDSDAADRTLADLGFEDVQVHAIVRASERIPAPNARRKVRAGDLLVLSGESEAIEKLVQERRFKLLGPDEDELTQTLENEDTVLMEAVVRPGSRLLGRTAKQLDLRGRYAIHLLGIAREGARLRGRVANTRFNQGDVLLVQGTRDVLASELSDLGTLPLAERELSLGQKSKARTASILFLLGLGSVALFGAPAPIAFVATAVAMIVTRVLSIRQAYGAVDGSVIVLLGAMIPIGLAIETSGLANLIAEGTVSLGASAPGWVVLAAVMIVSMFLSDLVNNAAAAVMMCPIALAAARGLEANPDPFLLSVAIGTSCAFLTPVGHQSNLLVMGPAGYRFGDYWRVGLVLEAIIVLIAVPALTLFWPL